MFEFLFKKREQETARDVELNKVYEELKKAYPSDNIPEIRKKYLPMHIQKYGYLTHPSPGARSLPATRSVSQSLTQAPPPRRPNSQGNPSAGSKSVVQTNSAGNTILYRY